MIDSTHSFIREHLRLVQNTLAIHSKCMRITNVCTNMSEYSDFSSQLTTADPTVTQLEDLNITVLVSRD
jgi:hypothetical protein